MTDRNIKAVVLDLDGTLVDTAPDFVLVLNQLRQDEGLAPLPYAAIREQVSNGSKALIELGFDIDESHPQFEPLRQRLLQSYADALGTDSRLFPGLETLLEHLQRSEIPWGIATNKPERYTTPLLAALQLQPGSVVCPEHVSEPKPHPESLHLASDHLACHPSQLIYVGDHERDIECGKRAGAITIAANYGYISPSSQAEQWGADHLVDHSHELLAQIRQYL